MKRILITGASRGLGLEFVRQFAALGHEIIACARAPEKAHELARVEGKVRVEALNVADFRAIDALAEKLSGETVDLLINNAGIYGPKNFAEGMAHQTLAGMDYANWEEVLHTNVLAPFRMIAAFTQALAHSQAGWIVNISSDLGSIAQNTMGGSHAYRTSKAALNMLTKGLAIELAPQGISVISMAPGWTQTDMGGPQARWTPRESVARQIETILRLNPADSGAFFNLEGARVAW